MHPAGSQALLGDNKLYPYAIRIWHAANKMCCDGIYSINLKQPTTTIENKIKWSLILCVHTRTLCSF